MRQFYDEIASAAGTFPVIAYHYPKVSLNDGIPVDVLPVLPIAGLKDSTGDPTRMLEQLAVYDGPVYSGSAAMALYASALGCTGAILAAANLEPELQCEGVRRRRRRPAVVARRPSHRVVRLTARPEARAARALRHTASLPPPPQLTRRPWRRLALLGNRCFAHPGAALLRPSPLQPPPYNPKTASSPTVTPGRSATAFTASSTPGMNELRSYESWRTVSD